ncbi:MAG: Txe/YoeB family addiction module toxin [Bacteroidetes bacterium]|nr:Txe/YoeB family addiction module toxin [Bacteroidota bacterium]
MLIEFTITAWDDFCFWMEQDEEMLRKIKELLKAIRRDPFKGLGKPEPLKFSLHGCWSRRITGEHRLVYKISGTKGIDQKCTVIQCRYHYDP